jgi:hypothetical protein
MDDLEKSGVAACRVKGIEAIHELVALVEVADDKLAGVFDDGLVRKIFIRRCCRRGRLSGKGGKDRATPPGVCPRR